MEIYDVTVIGGGPAGLAAAIEAGKNGASVCLIEREARLGGILKQCIHDGFGLLRFKEKLSGPEYVERFIDEFYGRSPDNTQKTVMTAKLQTFLTSAEKCDTGFRLTVVSRDGVETFESRTLVLAMGCRERTARQVFIHGTRPAGIFTAGAAQALVNIHGLIPVKKCVILGSGDIGMIMARRLTLEGAEVEGVYEVKSEPSGLTRNIVQCLKDYNIPLYLSHTVTRVFGDERLTGVEVAEVGPDMKPIDGTQRRIDCDSLILSVGLIPENEISEKLGVGLDSKTKGPVCDDKLMTDVPGIFACGNCLHVNDLVDYVSESGQTAGKNAAEYASALSGKGAVQKKAYASVNTDKNIAYVVPQRICTGAKKTIMYFRTGRTFGLAKIDITVNGSNIFSKSFQGLRPPEMEKITVDFSGSALSPSDKIEMKLSQI